MKIYNNGQLVDKEGMLEIFEPGFLFGWGAFETLRAYQGKIPFLAQHIARLNETSKHLALELVSLNFEEIIKTLLRENNVLDAYIRITAYKRREGTGVLVYIDQFGYYPQSVYDKGFRAIFTRHRRDAGNYFSKIKALSYLENRMAWHSAQASGNDEALILNKEGFLVGGSRSNLFLVRKKEVLTPSFANGATNGITRDIVMELARQMHIEVHEAELTQEDLFSCDEAFLTSALLEVMPLVECDGDPIGTAKPGPATRLFLEEYRKSL
ncbi:MAG: aminotransferase class IV [Candidatus Omnitrophota bacterium]